METKTVVSSAEVIKDNPSETSVKEQPTQSVKALSTINDKGLSRINLFDEKQLVAAENFITKVMRSEKGGIKSVNDGLAVLMRAQDLGLPFSTCLEHIHVINGKTGVDVHIIKALLLKAACTWEVSKDYQALYEYTDSNSVFIESKLPANAIICRNKEEADALYEKSNGENLYVYPVKYYKDVNGNIYKDYQLNSKFGIARNKDDVKKLTDSGKIPVFRIANQPVDYVTEYKFKRYRQMFGQIIETTSIGRFSYSEAVNAGCFDKDTYKKYPKIMIAHRAFTYGAREIASDVLFGVMETIELKQTYNIDIDEQDATII